MKKIIPALLALMLVTALVGCDANISIDKGLNSQVTGGQEVSGNDTAGNSNIVNQHNNTSSATNLNISADRAKEIALADAGVAEKDIREFEIELDSDKGVLHYDIEFKYQNYEYDYEIDAQTGDICERNKEIDN